MRRGRGVGRESGDMTGRQETFGTFGEEGDVEQNLLICWNIGDVVGEGEGLSGLWSCGESIYNAGLDGNAIGEERPLEAIVGERGEEILVEDIYLTARHIGGRSPYALLDIGDFEGVGIGASVGANETIDAEIVVGAVVGVPVAAVAEVCRTVGFMDSDYIVYEIPNEATLVGWVVSDNVPIFLEAATRVAHGVGVLALDEGLGWIFVEVALAVIVAEVHWAEDVGIVVAVGLLVLAWARGVGLLDPVVGGLKLVPKPDSLPRLQKMTEGWLRLAVTLRWLRSRCARA